MVEQPHLGPHAALVLYETLGPVLGEGNEGAAAVWGLAQTCFLAFPESVQRAGFADGERAVRRDLRRSERGARSRVDDYDETWARLDTPDGKVNLVIRELLDEFAELPADGPDARRRVPVRALGGGAALVDRQHDLPRSHVDEGRPRRRAAHEPGRRRSLGVTDGDGVVVETKRGRAETTVEVTDTLRDGHVSCPTVAGSRIPTTTASIASTASRRTSSPPTTTATGSRSRRTTSPSAPASKPSRQRKDMKRGLDSG